MEQFDRVRRAGGDDELDQHAAWAINAPPAAAAFGFDVAFDNVWVTSEVGVSVERAEVVVQVDEDAADEGEGAEGALHVEQPLVPG